ncbi:hypothetical protein OAO01_05105 [Oligoflexia bacterium]|nr:hypothetical protein [Oligoflexia bacterium]
MLVKARLLNTAVLVSMLALFGFGSGPAIAQQHSSRLNPQNDRASISLKDVAGEAKSRLHFAPLDLSGGTSLTVISSQEWVYLSHKLSNALKTIHSSYTNIFGKIPSFSTTLRLMNEDLFYQETGAPKWTNAMYYRKQIYIPLSKKNGVDLPNLARSIRHEYMHSVIHALSKGKCPGWLDEGLAQWAEKTENPALRPALLEWLRNHNVIGLDQLQGGFTKLDRDMVPPAYAQSLFAAKLIVSNYGFTKIRLYFDHLRSDEEKDQAFIKTFGISENGFQLQLSKALKAWQKKHQNLKRF